MILKAKFIYILKVQSREILTNVDYKRNVYLWEKQNIYYYILLNTYILSFHSLKIIELP